MLKHHSLEHHFVRHLPEVLEPGFLPSAVGFSGITYGPSDLALALSLSGSAGITTTAPAIGTSSDLPKLDRIPSHSDQVNIVLPIEVGYGDAGAVTQGLLSGQIFEADTPAGHVKVKVEGVQVYPSDGKLALALKFAAATGHSVFDTKGTVYLLATPALDPKLQTVALKDVTFTTSLDSALWSALTTVFNGQIKGFIESHAIYDLRPKIVAFQSALQAQLSDVAAKQNIVVSLNPTFLGLLEIQLQEKTLDVLAGFEARADLVVSDIKIPPIH